MPSHQSEYPCDTYQAPESSELSAKLAKADALQEQIDRIRPLEDSNLWQTIQFKLKADWTYDSNAIEGSTLDRSETIFFLSEGLTVKGKPLKDFLDAQNHAEAIEVLRDAVANRRPMTPGFMKELNALLLSGVTHTPAMDANGNWVKKRTTPGEYKKQPNSVVTPNGDVHTYVMPEQVPGEMEQLFRWVEEQKSNHAVFSAALAHYNFVRIHPFDDGNGRGARLLMNLILMNRGYVPAIIRMENRREYISYLDAANNGKLEPFCSFVADSLSDTQQTIIEILAKNSA